MKSPSARKILIVDDEDVVRVALRRTLETFGYRVSAASSAAEALEVMGQDREIEMVMTDHLMPRVTGLDLMRQVRRLYPEAVRIMLTGYADVGTAIQAINEGEVYRFITKPWDNTELMVTLGLAFEHHDERCEERRLATAARRGEGIAALEARHPGIGSVRRDASGAIVITEAEIQELLREEGLAEETAALNDRLLALP